MSRYFPEHLSRCMTRAELGETHNSDDHLNRKLCDRRSAIVVRNRSRAASAENESISTRRSIFTVRLQPGSAAGNCALISPSSSRSSSSLSSSAYHPETRRNQITQHEQGRLHRPRGPERGRPRLDEGGARHGELSPEEGVLREGWRGSADSWRGALVFLSTLRRKIGVHHSCFIPLYR